MKKELIFRGLTAVIAFIECIALGFSIAAFQFAPVINTFLGVSTSKLVPKEEGEVEIPTYFESDYAADVNNPTEEEIAKKNADVAAFVEQEEEEGAVLLKNDNNALPLGASERSVSLFGRATVNPYRKATSGGGSGGTSIDYLTAMQERGFKVNQTLVDAYRNDNSPKRDASSRIIGESPVSVYTADVRASFASTDIAIVILSRIGGENTDLYTTDSEGISQLALHKDEIDMLNIVKEYKDNGTFKKVIVLINSGHPMEVHWFDDYGVDAALWIGGPGNSTGFRGVADLLIGEANPSGRLVDTYATNSLSAPATVNFGDFSYTNTDDVAAGMTDNVSEGQYYVVQAEGIYVGYKYYETRYEDVVLGQGNADANVGVWASEGDSWSYADEVVYPFGYGLSYTTFTQTMDETVDNGDGTMTVRGTVTNTGSVAGKSVVELYAQTPYGDYEKENKVEKAAVQLVGFTKTDLIEPGDSEDYEITIDKYLLAAYDYTNAKTYIMSEGAYYLAVGDNAHDALNNILAAKGASGMVDAEGNPAAGNAGKVYSWEEEFDAETYGYTEHSQVTNRLDTADLNYWIEGGVTYLSRSDWEDTYPVSAVEITATSEMIAELSNGHYEKPADAPSVFDVQTGIPAGIKLADMYGVSFDDPLWDTFISQMTLPELLTVIFDSMGLAETVSINAPATSNSDGPDGIAGNAYVNESVAASSWSTEMLARRGYYMGEDALLAHKSQQAWCPGVNIHRTPFGGRNFEYYSEDATLSYILGAVQTKEMEAKGVSAAPKHFFANDQETHRVGVATFGNEQAFREIQLRAFEGAFVKGGASSTMTCFNRIGLTWIGHFSGVQEDLLRGEWGFVGIITTDASGLNSYMHSVDTLMNGTDIFNATRGAAGDQRTREINAAIYDNDDGAIVEQLKEIAHRIYYTYAHTNLMNGLSSDYDVVSVTPWWQPVIIVINCVLAAAAVGLGVAFTVSAYGKKNKKEGVGNVQK